MGQTNYVDINKLHQQHYHANEKIVKRTYGKKYPEILKQKLKPCEGCLLGKSHKARVKKKGNKKSKGQQPLDVLISDIKTMPAVGTHKARYAGSAIDQATKYVVITSIATKGQWDKRYEEIIKWIRNATGKVHKLWRTDGGKELVNKRTMQINKEEGIEHSETPAYTPNKNPSERFWRTMIEAVCAMLITAGMSSTWWVEAMKYMVYGYNRTPRPEFNGKTPYEKFYKREPHYVKMYTWGCLFYAHVNKEKRSKKQIEKARATALIGIDNSGRYLCIDVSTGELVTTDSGTAVDSIFPLGRHKAVFKKYEPAIILEFLENQREDVLEKMNYDSAGIEGGIASLKKILIEQNELSKASNQPTNLNSTARSRSRSRSPINSNSTDVLISSPIKKGEKDTSKVPIVEQDDQPTKTYEPENEIDNKHGSHGEATTSKSDTESDTDSDVYDSDISIDNTCKQYGIPTEKEITERIKENLEQSEENSAHDGKIETQYEERTNYEHDKISSEKEHRYPRRNRYPTGSNVRIMEHLAQTPQKERKTHRRVYKNSELEALANLILNDELDQQSKPIPQELEDAKQSPDWPKWEEAILKEVGALYRTKTLQKIEKLPAGVKAIKCRWVFKIKPPNDTKLDW